MKDPDLDQPDEREAKRILWVVALGFAIGMAYLFFIIATDL